MKYTQLTNKSKWENYMWLYCTLVKCAHKATVSAKQAHKIQIVHSPDSPDQSDILKYSTTENVK